VTLESREKIAELLKRKLDELKERDGDLAGKRRQALPRKVAPETSGQNPQRKIVSHSATTMPVGKNIPMFGEAFDPAASLSGPSGRLSQVAAQAPGYGIRNSGPGGRSPGPFVTDDADPYAQLDLWRTKYRGAGVREILADVLGHVESSGREDLLESVRTTNVMVPALSRQVAAEKVRRSLWLLPGVRDRMTATLCCEGAEVIDDLVDHPRFGRMAEKIIRWVDKGDTNRLLRLISERGGAAHPLNLAAAAWYDPSDVLFLDIETAGLFGGSQIVVAGLAYAARSSMPVEDAFDPEALFSPTAAASPAVVRILVATTPDAEAALVKETARVIADHPVLVSFNGKAFDLPFVCQRAAFYGEPVAADPVHFDLLGYSRRLWRGTTTNCRLSTLASEVLGLSREDDVPGALVPWFYDMYLKNPELNAGLLAAIAIHNSYDMEQTVRLYAEHLSRFATSDHAAPVLEGGAEDGR
jgi:uncharacterized protein YprB with RNaseH-like and TPR domain